ncbi:transposase [Streptomyces guryensis]|uniref:Transposase n=1 Tax=Streptomyces guryensis TaxID=2886947 RepID=A0A9Q3ZA59_9ACTN|nr:transposase [Streptomyces guryensis]MCD9881006.1 transposase [Streptomyces guryensis]
MNDEDRADVIDLIDVKVTLQSPVPVRIGRSSCAVGVWFKERGLLIPVEVLDAAWAIIQPLVTKTGRGSGKSTDLPVRDAVEAILWKARMAKTWNEAAARMTYGVGKPLMSRWTRWSADGTCERVAEALVEVQGFRRFRCPNHRKGRRCLRCWSRAWSSPACSSRTMTTTWTVKRAMERSRRVPP